MDQEAAVRAVVVVVADAAVVVVVDCDLEDARWALHAHRHTFGQRELSISIY